MDSRDASASKNFTDRHVNEPMLAEMMNIIGFHLPPNLSTRWVAIMIHK